MKRSSTLKRSGRIKPKKRSASEFQRIYGGEKRIRWMARQPCIVCGLQASETAHIENGGMSRKADAGLTVPICAADHRELHRIGKASFEKRYDLDLAALAAVTELAWRAHLRASA